jgi:regulatory protein
LQCLARREYSRVELRAKLQVHTQAGANSGQADFADLDALLDDLAARGWLSDERAASQWAHAKRARLGTLRIAHELRQKGIAEELIGAVLPELKATELEAAQQVWQRKFGAMPQDGREKPDRCASCNRGVLISM